jgi:acetate kinase
MGLTPLEGLPGATRSGNIDPSLIFHYTSHASRLSASSTSKIAITQAEQILNKESGWLALTGTTDFGVITSRALQGDEEAMLAVDIMVDRVVGFVGGYWLKMGGRVDALVFAGGIGERGTEFRRRVCEQTEILGFKLDKRNNERVGQDEVVEISGGERKVLVVRTDEQACPPS